MHQNASGVNLDAFLKAITYQECFVRNSTSTLKKALDKRMDYFAAHGCTISDHGLEQIRYTETSGKKLCP